MKTISGYREDLARLVKKVGDIDAKLVAEGRDPSETEIKLKTELMDNVDELQTIIATQERQERMTASLAATPAPITRPTPQGHARPEGAEKKDKFLSFGEQMAAVMRAGLPNGHTDPRLFRAAAASGMSESVPSDGGLA
jgi:HK97 family phage major capsid protein